MKWTGLDEFVRDLQNLPADLAAEAGDIVKQAATETRDETVAVYQQHRHSGNLADHVRMDLQASGPYGVVARVRATAKHAHFFERGTQVRHSAFGNRGSMPATPTLIRIAPRKRRAMFAQLRELLLRHGASKVEGEP